MKKILSLTIIFLLSCMLISNAEEIQRGSVEKVDLTFEQAYELMMANNSAIKACLEEINARKYEKNAAIGEFFPKIGFNTTYAHFNQDISVKPNNVSFMGMSIPVDSITLQEQNVWTAGFGAVWNVFTGGKILALNSAARAKLQATNDKYKALTNSLTVELVKRYYGLKLAQDVADVKKAVLATVRKHYEDAKMLEEAGFIAKSERLHADVAYKNAERDYDIAIKDIEIAQAALLALIKDNEIEIASYEINPTSELFIYKDDLTKLDEFKETALKENPNLKQLQSKTKLAQANYRSNVGSYMPVISLFAYDIAASSRLSDQVPRFGVGAMANMELFSGFSRYNKIKAADAFRKQVYYENLDAQINIETLVTKNYKEYLKNKDVYNSTDKSIENATEALRTASLAFKEGYGTSLSVTDAQTALMAIKVQRLNSIYNCDKSLTELLSTKGSAEEILEYIKKSDKEGL